MSHFKMQPKEEVRGRAVGMLEGGMSQKKVADSVGISVRTLKRWWKQYRSTGNLQKGKSTGRPPVLKRIQKIVISKSVGKKRQSVRKMAAKFEKMGMKGSKSTIHDYFKKKLGLKAYRIQKVPKLTKKHILARKLFCARVQNWSNDDWKQVIFSDESPFQLFPPPNKQNDRIWTNDRSSVDTAEIPKFGPTVMVWGAMSFSGLSELHIVPQGHTVTGEYYREEILKGNLFPRLANMQNNGSKFTTKFVPDMSRVIFQQDGAKAHTALETQKLLEKKLPNFWSKDMWPANSPDLSPIENLWSILGEALKEMKRPPTTIRSLEKALKTAWKKIPLETLQNLIFSMPDRVAAVKRVKGKFPVN